MGEPKALLVAPESGHCATPLRGPLHTLLRDHICSIGQALAAHDLCGKLAPYRKQHHLHATVGHCGVFNGNRWDRQIFPRLRDFIHAFDE